MKRFYCEVALVAGPEGDALLLDGRPVRTPGRRALVAPDVRIAEAAAAEWRAQGERIDPATMPVTRFLNSVIDRVAGREAATVDEVLAYGPTDLLCYRAEGPEALVRREAEARDPALAWLARTRGVVLATGTGVRPRPQAPAALDALRRAVARHDACHLIALHDATKLAGSVVLGLALVERALDRATFWRAAMVEEDWQREQWGEDAEAERRRAALARELDEIVLWLDLIG